MCRRQPGIGKFLIFKPVSVLSPDQVIIHFLLLLIISPLKLLAVSVRNAMESGKRIFSFNGPWNVTDDGFLSIIVVVLVGVGHSPVCDSYVRPETLVRICDECNFGTYGGRCIICGSPGEDFSIIFPPPPHHHPGYRLPRRFIVNSHTCFLVSFRNLGCLLLCRVYALGERS
jgi:hypothetical protein